MNRSFHRIKTEKAVASVIIPRLQHCGRRQYHGSCAFLPPKDPRLVSENSSKWRCREGHSNFHRLNVGKLINSEEHHQGHQVTLVQLRTFLTSTTRLLMTEKTESIEEGVCEMSLNGKNAGSAPRDNTEELIAAAIAAGTLSPSNEDGSAKTKNQLKNELKKAAKLEKFAAKQEKIAADGKTVGAGGSGGKMKTMDMKSEVDEALLQVPAGAKKPITKMADAYAPKAVESCWYAWWEKEGFFKPKAQVEGEEEVKFVMVVPPPNVTGSLHLGHTLTAAVEDSLARWHRMQGHAVLYIPGSDHAGIATQAVVEKRLKRERNLTKHELGREAFLKEVWKWRDTYGDRIYDQFRRMGGSVDWGRVCFTLDPKAVAAVTEAFCRLFEDGLIFRANRLVHWSGKLKTALSDLEVETREIEPRTLLPAHGHDPKKRYEFGVMTSFAYRLSGDDERELVISTTRPETVFADVALAVNPGDARYVAFHGRQVIHPVTGGLIPVICDEAADPEFGTGALKVSPGHDHVDFEIGRRHGLPCISIFDEDNRLLPLCGAGFAGLARYDAREAVVAYCRANGTFRGDAPHAMTLPICTRSGDFVEPRLMPQWWLNCRGMAADAVESVRSGQLTINPREHEREWYYWLENIRDWCLSRQLWWGHRIPAYRVLLDGRSPRRESVAVSGGAASDENGEVWVTGRDEEEARARAVALINDASIEATRITLQQDEDVLDTWFSSGLWPLTTVNWPQTADADFQRFYPQSVLETGSDILFFWVARMVMLGKHLTGQLPFTQILLHAMVRDAYGRKMSKSLGNVIDPLDVIEGCTLEGLQAQLDGGNLDAAEVTIAKAGQKRDFPHGIPECGTDALRFALCSYVAQGRDINLNINRVEGYRRFCNKLWNAVRFALMKLEGTLAQEEPHPSTHRDLEALGVLSVVDCWILAKLARAADVCNRNFETFNLANVAGACHQLWLYEICDVYIEAVKPRLATSPQARGVLRHVLESALRLLHPMMPFLTEELWQHLSAISTGGSLPVPSICLSPYPSCDLLTSLPSQWSQNEQTFEKLYDIVRAVRSAVTDRKLPPKTTKLALRPNSALKPMMLQEAECLQALVKTVGSCEILAADGGAGDKIELFAENPELSCTLYTLQ